MEEDYMQYKICTPRDPRFVQMLVDEYNTTNISLHDLSKKYHTDAGYQFRIHNIPIRPKGVQRSLTRTSCIELKWNFDKIRTEEQAYIVGLLFADGYITQMQIGLRLKISDKELLTKVKNYFSEDIKLQENMNSCSFVISSEIACENLKRLGKVKTGESIHIPQMDKSLMRHFIRGYFDGDGTIFVCNNGRNYKNFKANICCVTTGILEEFQAILQENNIDSTINKENRKGKIMRVLNGQCLCSFDMYRLFIRKKDSLLNFYHFLYNNCSMWIERKREVFENNMDLFTYMRPKKIPS